MKLRTTEVAYHNSDKIQDSTTLFFILQHSKKLTACFFVKNSLTRLRQNFSCSDIFPFLVCKTKCVSLLTSNVLGLKLDLEFQIYASLQVKEARGLLTFMTHSDHCIPDTFTVKTSDKYILFHPLA